MSEKQQLKPLLTVAEDGSIFVASNGSISTVCSQETRQNGQPEYISIEQACEITGFSRWTISRWLKQKDKKGNYRILWIKLGTARCSRVRIDKVSFMAYLESKTVHPQEEEVKS